MNKPRPSMDVKGLAGLVSDDVKISIPDPTAPAVGVAAPQPQAAKEQTKEDQIAQLQLDLESAKEDAKLKNDLSKDIAKQLIVANDLVAELTEKLRKLNTKSEAEAEREYFAAQKAERERQAAMYQKAVAGGFLTPAQAALLGIGKSPIDLALGSRNNMQLGNRR